MNEEKKSNQSGFSLIELTIAVVIMLVALGIVSMVLSRSFSVRARESRKADALVSAQAALNVISRELSNSGFGIYIDPESAVSNNGLVADDCGLNQIRFRSNINNIVPYGSTAQIDQPREDLTYYFDSATNSIVRYDPYASPQTSVVVNRISSAVFRYYNYTGANPTATEVTTPSADTGRVTVTVTVVLDPVEGQPDNQTVTFTTDVTLRNSTYMLNLY